MEQQTPELILNDLHNKSIRIPLVLCENYAVPKDSIGYVQLSNLLRSIVINECKEGWLSTLSDQPEGTDLQPDKARHLKLVFELDSSNVKKKTLFLIEFAPDKFKVDDIEHGFIAIFQINLACFIDKHSLNSPKYDSYKKHIETFKNLATEKTNLKKSKTTSNFKEKDINKLSKSMKRLKLDSLPNLPINISVKDFHTLQIIIPQGKDVNYLFDEKGQKQMFKESENVNLKFDNVNKQSQECTDKVVEFSFGQNNCQHWNHEECSKCKDGQNELLGKRYNSSYKVNSFFDIQESDSSKGKTQVDQIQTELSSNRDSKQKHNLDPEQNLSPNQQELIPVKTENLLYNDFEKIKPVKEQQQSNEVIDLDDEDSESETDNDISEKNGKNLKGIQNPIEPNPKFLLKLPFIEQKEPVEWNNLSDDANFPKLFAPEGYSECQNSNKNHNQISIFDKLLFFTFSTKTFKPFFKYIFIEKKIIFLSKF